jgi:hypothetical protein
MAGQIYFYLAGGLVLIRPATTPMNTSAHYLAHLYLQAFDALIHFTFEGPWLYLSTFGRQVNTSEGVFAELCTLVALLNLSSP